MTLNPKTAHFADDSKVWIYQSNRPFSETELVALQKQLDEFAQQWASHARELKAAAWVAHRRFVILMVDESQAAASGCSIDTSVHFLKMLEQAYNVTLFERMTFAFELQGDIHTADRGTFAELYKRGGINDQTRVFNNLVATKRDLENHWLIPLADSWHKRLVSLP